MEEKKFKIELTPSQVEIVYRGLLELPTKFALPVMNEIDRMIKSQQDEVMPKPEVEVTPPEDDRKSKKTKS